MASGFSDDFKELVRSRTDIASLIGESVTLTAVSGGREYVCLCPFHDDHKPSMRVYPDRQSYRCWVCDEGGDCFSWIMKIDGAGFREALEILARKANLEVPRHHRSQSGGNEKTDLYDVLAWAESQFHQCLMHSQQGAVVRKYLDGRGYDRETIEKFRLGYHPDDWEWLQNQGRGRFSAQQLLSVRLIGQSERRPGYYDNFVDRVLFPIHDTRGRTVAFGGRILPGNENPNLSKYWNSPESPVFTKSNQLYGIPVARDAIKRSQTVVVMEGYTDCITAHQHGICNVVATLGTALTDAHVANLKRFAHKVVLLFDGDDAGKNAAGRALVRFIAQDVDLRVLILPGGMDPADFLAKDGADELQARIDNAVEAWEFKLQEEIELYGLESVDAQHRVLNAMLELLSQAPKLANSVRQDIIVGRLAQRLRIPEQVVRKRLNEIRQKKTGRRIRIDSASDEKRTQKLNKDDQLECDLIGIIFTNPATLARIKQDVGVDDFQNPFIRRLFETCWDLIEHDHEPTFENVTTATEDVSLKQWAVRIDEMARNQKLAEKLKHGNTTASSEQDMPELLRQTLEDLKWRRDERKYQKYKGEIARTDSPAGLDPELKSQLQQLSDYHQKRATRQKQKSSTES